MKVARYSRGEDSSNLYCAFTLSTEEYQQLGCSAVKIRLTENNVIISPGSNFVIRPRTSARSDDTFIIHCNEPVFPGTKTFGVEALPTVFIEGALVADLPRMLMPVKQVERLLKPKQPEHAELDTGSLIRALNAQRKADKRLSFALDVDGYIKATKEFS